MRPFYALALVLGTATSARSEPKLEFSPAQTHEAVPQRFEESRGRYVLEPRPVRTSSQVRAVTTEWMSLATPTPARHGTEFISIDGDLGPIATLRISSYSGRVIVTRVKVVFEDDRPLVDKRRVVLDAKRKPFVIALGDPKRIHHIEVTTDPRTDGAYIVDGSSNVMVVARRPMVAKRARSR